ncbi:GOLM25 protein [Tanacetum coccineum]
MTMANALPPEVTMKDARDHAKKTLPDLCVSVEAKIPEKKNMHRMLFVRRSELARKDDQKGAIEAFHVFKSFLGVSGQPVLKANGCYIDAYFTAVDKFREVLKDEHTIVISCNHCGGIWAVVETQKTPFGATPQKVYLSLKVLLSVTSYGAELGREHFIDIAYDDPSPFSRGLVILQTVCFVAYEKITRATIDVFSVMLLLFHVDFVYILGRDPKTFPSPMKLFKEMLEAIDGA